MDSIISRDISIVRIGADPNLTRVVALLHCIGRVFDEQLLSNTPTKDTGDTSVRGTLESVFKTLQTRLDPFLAGTANHQSGEVRISTVNSNAR